MKKKMAFYASTLLSLFSVAFLAAAANTYFAAQSDMADLEKVLASYREYSAKKSDESLNLIRGYESRYSIAAHMVQTIFAGNGDMKQRDKILVDSLNNMPDYELYTFLSYNKKLFMESEKKSELESIAAIPSEKMKAIQIKRLETTFTAEELERINACYSNLDGRYGNGYKLVAGRFFHDIAKTYTCKI